MSKPETEKPRAKVTMIDCTATNMKPGSYGFVINGIPQNAEVYASNNKADTIDGGVGFSFNFELPSQIVDALDRLDQEDRKKFLELARSIKMEKAGTARFLSTYQSIISIAADNVGFWGVVLPALSSWLFSGA